MAKRLGIYIHIPFCASKCGYCDFYSLAGCEHLMPEYHQALLAHLKESAQSIKAYEVDSLYFGGGTPSFYGADRIADIFNTLKLNGESRPVQALRETWENDRDKAGRIAAILGTLAELMAGADIDDPAELARNVSELF